MKQHFVKPTIYASMYGELYVCEHPVYNSCTLYKLENKGLAVIQQRFDAVQKCTYWTDIDPYLTDVIYLHKDFLEYFDAYAGYCSDDGLYPTVTIRQIMWGLKMKPLPKEPWETVFDRKNV